MVLHMALNFAKDPCAGNLADSSQVVCGQLVFFFWPVINQADEEPLAERGELPRRYSGQQGETYVKVLRESLLTAMQQ